MDVCYILSLMRKHGNKQNTKKMNFYWRVHAYLAISFVHVRLKVVFEVQNTLCPLTHFYSEAKARHTHRNNMALHLQVAFCS